MKKNLLLTLGSILFTLLLLEIGLRVASPLFSNQPDPFQAERHLYSPYRGHELNPLFNTRNNTDGRRIHSPDGFRRDAAVPVAKPPKTIRIFAMGASTLYGLGTWGGIYPNHRDLFNDELATSYLERSLNRELASEGSEWRVEVVNTAVIAYHTFQQLVYLNERLLSYAPDIVINVEGHNDFYIADPDYEPWRMYPYSSAALMEEINRRDAFTAFHFLVRALAAHSALAAQLEKRFTRPLFDERLNALRTFKLHVDMEHLDRDYPATARKTFLRAYWQITRLGELEGFRHIVYLQPEIALEAPEALGKADRHIRELTVENLRHPPEFMRRIHEMLPALFAKYGIEYHDASRLTREGSTPDLYLDYCHLTPKGSERLAENIYPSLLSAVRERIAQRQARETN